LHGKSHFRLIVPSISGLAWYGQAEMALAPQRKVLFYPIAMNRTSSTVLFSAIVEAPFGAIGIRTEPGVVRELVYLPSQFDEKAPVDALSERAAQQVERYLADADFRFDLPLAEVGTAFQRKVWEVISSIPRGDVLTYGEVAKIIRSAPRAVGQACGANWFPLVIPCHRVTATGSLGGFSNHDDETGFHLGIKRWLLRHEGVEGY
jgi:methylated-DNA-[protein]-cysteine S-methyltransferase